MRSGCLALLVLTLALGCAQGVEDEGFAGDGDAGTGTGSARDAGPGARLDAGPGGEPDAGPGGENDATAPADAGGDTAQPPADAGHDAGDRVDAGHDAGSDAGADTGGCTGTTGAVLINEVRSESSSSPFDQFVELYNTGTCPVGLAGYHLGFREAHGTNETTLWTGKAADTIGGGAYFLIAGNDFIGTRDASLQADLIARAGGGFGLYSGAGLVDSLGWGSATNAFVRVAAAVSPSITQSLARQPNGQDTRNSYADFFATAAQTPRAAN